MLTDMAELKIVYLVTGLYITTPDHAKEIGFIPVTQCGIDNAAAGGSLCEGLNQSLGLKIVVAGSAKRDELEALLTIADATSLIDDAASGGDAEQSKPIRTSFTRGISSNIFTIPH